MRPSRHWVRETILAKRQWHSPPDPEAARLGFRGWHSRGYLQHFDMPGFPQMLNYRLDDAMPASRRHEWAELLKIEDEPKWRTERFDFRFCSFRQLCSGRQNDDAILDPSGHAHGYY